MRLSLKELRLSRFTTGAMVVVGVAAVFWLGLLLSGALDSPKHLGERKKVDPNRCPHCDHALTPYARELGQCLFCKGDLPGKESASSPRSTGIAVTLVSLFLVLLAVNVAFLVRRMRGKKPQEEEVHHLYCRKCGRKIRYRTGQAGQLARCPMCRQLVRFPEPPAPEKRPWWRGWKKQQPA